MVSIDPHRCPLRGQIISGVQSSRRQAHFSRDRIRAKGCQIFLMTGATIVAPVVLAYSAFAFHVLGRHRRMDGPTEDIVSPTRVPCYGLVGVFP